MKLRANNLKINILEPKLKCKPTRAKYSLTSVLVSKAKSQLLCAQCFSAYNPVNSELVPELEKALSTKNTS